MTKIEFSQIALAMQTYYPKENLFQTDESIVLWYNILKDIEYPVMSMALDKWAVTNKWSPTISELREFCLQITVGNLPDWGEAYESVMKAISNYGYQRETEALASLDELTRKVVKRLGFKTLCLSPITNKVQDRANFRDLYIQLASEEREKMKMPETLNNRIEKTQKDYLSEKKQEMLEANDV